MIFPCPPWSRRCWMNRPQQKNIPYRLVRMARSQVAVSRSATGVPEASTPASFIRMSSLLNSARASSNIASTWCSTLMSPCTTTARWPVLSISDFVWFAPAWSCR